MITIKFNPNPPVIHKFSEYGIQADNDSDSNENPDLKKVEVNFIKGPITKPLHQDFFQASFDTRSAPYAQVLLQNLISKLRSGIPIPEQEAPMLADALERVLESRESVHFLYGPQEVAGRSPTDMFTEFMIFLMIEEKYQKVGRYGTNREGLGAYELVKSDLEQKGSFREVDAIRRIRREVIKKASSDADYLTQLLHFLKGFGYKPQ